MIYSLNKQNQGVKAGMQERRRTVRWAISQPVTYKLKDTEKECICKCRDLGPKGINLELRQKLSQDALINLEIWLQDIGRILATGKVVWQKQLDDSTDSFRAGLSFINISDFDKEKIFKYMFSHYREKVIERWWQGVN